MFKVNDDYVLNLLQKLNLQETIEQTVKNSLPHGKSYRFPKVNILTSDRSISDMSGYLLYKVSSVTEGVQFPINIIKEITITIHYSYITDMINSHFILCKKPTEHVVNMLNLLLVKLTYLVIMNNVSNNSNYLSIIDNEIGTIIDSIGYYDCNYTDYIKEILKNLWILNDEVK